MISYHHPCDSRQPGHLVKLVLRHSKSLPAFEHDSTDMPPQVAAEAVLDSPWHSAVESDATVSPYQPVHPQAVAISDLDDSRYTSISRRRSNGACSYTAELGHYPEDRPVVSCFRGLYSRAHTWTWYAHTYKLPGRRHSIPQNWIRVPGVRCSSGCGTSTCQEHQHFWRIGHVDT